MKKELSLKQIYEDFVTKTTLTESEKEILDLYIKDESIIKIASKTMQSTATVSRSIANIKEKYNNYKKIELSKLYILQKNTK